MAESPSDAHHRDPHGRGDGSVCSLSARSPTPSLTSSQPFIYPIKSAVSVKGSRGRQRSDTGSVVSHTSAWVSLRGGGAADEGAAAVESAAPPPPPWQAGTHQARRRNLAPHATAESVEDTQSGSSRSASRGDAGPENLPSSPSPLAAPPPIIAGAAEGATPGASTVQPIVRLGAADFRVSPPSATPDEDAASATPSGSVVDREQQEQRTQPRFRHVVTDEGHMVVTGRDGQLMRCEDEPIHIPGAVQAFGCMIVVRETDDGSLQVRQASENTGDILGLSPAYLFKMPSFLDCLDEDQADVLWLSIEALEYSDEDVAKFGPQVFQLAGWGQPGPGTGKARARRHWSCWVAAHRPEKQPSGGHAPLTVLEFELVDDTLNPPSTAPRPAAAGEDVSTSGDGIEPDVRVSVSDAEGKMHATSVPSAAEPLGGLEGMPYMPTLEQILESTRSHSEPIKALARLRSGHRDAKATPRRARPRRAPAGGPGLGTVRMESQGTDMLDLFGVLSQANDQLAAQNDLQGFLKVTVGILREITGFSRVMMYQFDERWNGQVVCELVDWNDTHDLYRGLHFPASDIPAQARELYVINKVRLLYDRDAPSARMVCREAVDLETPIDMTHSYLRAMSPIHLKYLGNMGVRASMSISIMAFDQLWGLLAMHSYGQHGKRVTFPVRQLCRLLGESISRNIERLSYSRRLSARKLINTIPTDKSPSGYIISNAEDLLALFDADFGVIAIGHEAKILGPLTASQEVLAVTEYLRIKKFQHMLTSQDVSKDFPDMELPQGLEIIAGLLLIPLSSSGIDFIAFLRKAQTRHVNWGGRPFKEGKEASAVLEPRKSFKIWSEVVTGTSRAWKDEELETASVLCLVYGKFISVWRQREQATRYNQLNKLLLSNASHEVRTPLNHIINYLELALDSPLDDETRENLTKSHMASKSLLFVINDLLDLTRQEQGKKLFLQEPFDLAQAIREAVEMHEWEAKRRQIQFTIVTEPETIMVLGDKNRLRQVVTNTVTNSVKHTSEGRIQVEARRHGAHETTNELPEGCDVEVEIVVSDTGEGIAREKLETIFREFEQVESVLAESPASSSTGANGEGGAAVESSTELTGKAEPSRGADSALGLGLAVVARIVRNLGGQLRVESTVGQGSRFAYYIPFREAPAAASHKESQESGWARRGSEHGMQRTLSLASGDSGRSELSSLVEALSAPHLTDEPLPPLEADVRSGAVGLEEHRRASVDVRTGSPAGVFPLFGNGSGGNSAAGSLFGASSPRPSTTTNGTPMSLRGQRPVEGSLVPLRPVKLDADTIDTSEEAAVLASRGSVEPPLPPPPPTATESRAAGGGPRAQQPKLEVPPRPGPSFVSVPMELPLLTPQPTRQGAPPDLQAVRRETYSFPPAPKEGQAASDASASSGATAGKSGGSSVRRASTTTGSAPTGSARGPRSTPPLRVLIVEDDPVNLMILKKRLVRDGHAALQAVNGEEGVRVYEEHAEELDVVLMDLQMPICGGQEACRRIRALERRQGAGRGGGRSDEGDADEVYEGDDRRPPDGVRVEGRRVPVLAVSATLTLQMREELCACGMDGWVLKPIDHARLRELLVGVTCAEQRLEELWKPGKNWERGGWLTPPPQKSSTSKPSSDS